MNDTVIPIHVGDDIPFVLIAVPKEHYPEAIARLAGPGPTTAEPHTDTQHKRWLTVTEAAERLPFSRAKLWELLGSGEIPSVKRGGRRVIDVRALDAYMAD